MERLLLPQSPALSTTTESLLRRFGALLLEINERVRLVGPRDGETLWREHITDCLRLLPLLPQKGRVADVGTGGGLPGAVLAVCRPDLEFVLLDSLSRKTRALSSVITALGLENARVVCARSEDYAAGNREQCACAVARAVSEAGVIAEYLSPLVSPGGKALAMKGSSVGKELMALDGRWNTLGLGEPRLYEYEHHGRYGCVLEWNKASPCPESYPRRPGRAEKKPWWR